MVSPKTKFSGKLLSTQVMYDEFGVLLPGTLKKE